MLVLLHMPLFTHWNTFLFITYSTIIYKKLFAWSASCLQAEPFSFTGGDAFASCLILIRAVRIFLFPEMQKDDFPARSHAASQKTHAPHSTRLRRYWAPSPEAPIGLLHWTESPARCSTTYATLLTLQRKSYSNCNTAVSTASSRPLDRRKTLSSSFSLNSVNRVNHWYPRHNRQ
jgi:hypothetical protein